MANKNVLRMKDEGSLVAVIGDEDTVTGFCLAGIGNVEKKGKSNFLVVDRDTSKELIEETFKELTESNDIAIILITQDVAEIIRHLLDDYNKLIPTILEIPSKDHPYDPRKDFIMQRIKRLTGHD